MNEIIIIDNLTENDVIIKKQKIIVDDGVQYNIGLPNTTCYVNSEKDREKIQTILESKYINAILAVWGDTPTIDN